MIVSAFPGIGKTYLYNHATDLYQIHCRRVTDLYSNQTAIKDSDSSQFDKKDFPNNYIKSIKQNMDYYDLLLVSSHIQVRQQLKTHQIPYYLVYPQKDLKQAYLERYKQRGSPLSFVQLLEDNWDDWITSCEQDNYAHHVVLHKATEHLSDLFDIKLPRGSLNIQVNCNF